MLPLSKLINLQFENTNIKKKLNLWAKREFLLFEYWNNARIFKRLSFFFEIAIWINCINIFFTWRLSCFWKDPSQKPHRLCEARKVLWPHITGCAAEKRSIMFPLCPRVYLVMHRWKICPGPTQIRSWTFSFLSTDLRLLQREWRMIAKSKEW